MKILIVTTRFGEGLGGKENYLVSLSREFLAMGHEVRVVARSFDAFPEFSDARRFTAPGCDPPVLKAVGPELHRLAPRGSVSLLGPLTYKLHFYAWGFGVAIRAFHHIWGASLDRHVRWSDIVHYDGTGLELLGFSALRSCRSWGRRLVICPHAHPGSWGDHVRDLDLYRLADGLITKTEYEKSFFVSREMDPNRIHVIGNGPHLPESGDPDDLARRLEIRFPVVLFVGRRSQSKGYPTLVEAMHRVWIDQPRVCLLVLSPLDDLASTQDQNPLDSRIISLPGASESDKDAAYRLADVLCLPSRAEAFGMALIEAWRHGKPVIAGRIPALEEVVTDGVDGWLVPQEAGALAHKIAMVLEDPEAARRMGRAGQSKVREKYDWGSIAARTLAVYVGQSEPVL